MMNILNNNKSACNSGCTHMNEVHSPVGITKPLFLAVNSLKLTTKATQSPRMCISIMLASKVDMVSAYKVRVKDELSNDVLKMRE